MGDADQSLRSRRERELKQAIHSPRPIVELTGHLHEELADDLIQWVAAHQCERDIALRLVPDLHRVDLPPAGVLAPGFCSVPPDHVVILKIDSRRGNDPAPQLGSCSGARVLPRRPCLDASAAAFGGAVLKAPRGRLARAAHFGGDSRPR